MKQFIGLASNGKYSVGCTGQTVYLYDKEGKEIAKFKDLTYAYAPLISPDGKIFVVKSTTGRLAVYSLETYSLIKKFRFSNVDGAQDDNFCFSPDGRELYNIERQTDELKTALSIYDTSDFSLKKRILCDDYNVVLSAVEYSAEENRIFLLGFIRDEKSGVACKYFVGELLEETLQNIVSIRSSEHDFYLDCKDIELYGEALCCGILGSYTGEEIERIRKAKHSLAKLWKYYAK